MPKRRVVLLEGHCLGEVAWYRADRGYGFLCDDDETGKGVYGELFFDRDERVGTEPESIEEGVKLSFKVEHDQFGLKAVEVNFGD